MTLKTRVAAFAALLFLMSAPAWALEKSLFKRYEGKTVKVYVAVEDGSKGGEVGAALVKEKFEKALASRKSITFKPVSSVEEADLAVDVKVLGFTWTDHDPVDMLMGVGGTAMDAAVIEDYAAVEADTAVREVRSKSVLWKERLFATVTKKPMPRPDSLPIVTEELAKIFLRDCFSKKRS